MLDAARQFERQVMGPPVSGDMIELSRPRAWDAPLCYGEVWGQHGEVLVPLPAVTRKCSTCPATPAPPQGLSALPAAGPMWSILGDMLIASAVLDAARMEGGRPRHGLGALARQGLGAGLPTTQRVASIVGTGASTAGAIGAAVSGGASAFATAAPLLAAAIPIVGVAAVVVALLAHFMGGGCGEACIDAS